MKSFNSVLYVVTDPKIQIRQTQTTNLDNLECTHEDGFFKFLSFIFISWRLITLQYCSGFCHTLT